MTVHAICLLMLLTGNQTHSKNPAWKNAQDILVESEVKVGFHVDGKLSMGTSVDDPFASAFPVELGRRLILTRKGKALVVQNAPGLAGYVRIRTATEALQYARLRTWPSLYLMSWAPKRDLFVEVLPVSVWNSERDRFGLMAPYGGTNDGDGYQGVIRDEEFAKSIKRAVIVKWRNGRYEIRRVLAKVYAFTDHPPLYSITEQVWPDGKYSQVGITEIAAHASMTIYFPTYK